MFRRSFVIDQCLLQASLSLSGLGYHDAWINGTRVGDHVLDPAQTDYEKRVFYVTHDVTQLVRSGPNVIGILLGNGWYNQDRVWAEGGYSYGAPRLLAELTLTYENGEQQVIRADEGWRWAPSPITDNNVYAGECYDARLEQDGWCRPDFDDLHWQGVIAVGAPGGELQEQAVQPMRRIEELRPASVTKMDSGCFVVDMGQNFSGWVRIMVSAPAGTEVVMRFAEAVSPDGEIDTGSTGVFATKVEQVDRYVCRGAGQEEWEPRFTYHGFRYVEVAGWPGDLMADDITGVVVHTDLPAAGGFECSDERLNTLHRMALWTHRSNIHGIPEDCPARERCGWLGDANLVAEYSLWNYDSKLFWEKFLGDIETTRAANGGIPCNIAPGKRGKRGNANPDWAAAFIMLPWYIYLFSGDVKVLSGHWQGMTKLMDHFREASEEWILQGGYGDFFDPGTEAIVQHTPQTLSTTLWFFRCACVMASAADALGHKSASRRYAEWASNISAATAARFFDARKGSFGSQGADTLALAFNVFPSEKSRILAALVDDIKGRDTHMNVGVMGVRFILEVLTRNGHGELALALMRQNSYPSFGHIIGRGATTLWECWGEAGHDGTHGPRSLNHPFMGGYDNWFFNTLAGIRPDPENPGFRHFFVEPHPVPGIEWVRCHHSSSFGRIESSWKYAQDCLEWEVAVPQGATATLCLPTGSESLALGHGKHAGEVDLRSVIG